MRTRVSHVRIRLTSMDLYDMEFLQVRAGRIKIKSKETGYIKSINTEKIGWALVEIGCGKKVISDTLDYSAGIKTNFEVGDKIHKGDIIYELFRFNEKKLKIAKKILTKTFTISEQEQEQEKLIIE